jgi:hypothetical protein
MRSETLVAKTEHSHTYTIDFGTFEPKKEDLGLLPYGIHSNQTHSVITAAVSDNQTLVSRFTYGYCFISLIETVFVL